MSNELGIDRSGNNNNWTVNNITIADQMVDSPTNNFATLNPLNSNGSPTYLEGNLKYTNGYNYGIYGTMGMSSGKWYWENITEGTSITVILGIVHEDSLHDTFDNAYGGGMNDYGGSSKARGYLSLDGSKLDDSSKTSYALSFAGTDVMGIAFDADNGTLIFYKNGVSQGTSFTSLPSGTWFPLIHTFGNYYNIANFGQDSSFAGNKTAQGNQDSNSIGDFYYTPPSGFLALCTSNLPAVAVVPSEHFNTVLYTGDDSTNSITGVGFQPDFVWLKNRSAATNHRLYNSLTYGGPYSAGASGSKYLRSNTTDAELTGSYKSLISLDSDGFTVHSTGSDTNRASDNYVAWNWKANGSGSSNTDGSITSTVSANVDSGFSIVSYTGTGTAGATIGHGLSKAPEMVIVKSRSLSGKNWPTYHIATGNTNRTKLNATDATGSSSAWNNTTPSASLITLGSQSEVNTASATQIAYCFHSVDGYSKVGSYTGNGNADGTFVYTGFRPAFVMAKVSTAGTHGWGIYNSKSKTYNYLGNVLQANATNAEMTSEFLDFTSNGFKHRTSSTWNNGSGQTYIYIAFAETPFKFSNAR